MPVLQPIKKLYFGCDPEGFFDKHGHILGAEKVLPGNGLWIGAGKCVCDGIQFELQPMASENIKSLSYNISNIMDILDIHLKKAGDIGLSTRTVVEVEEVELAALSDAARLLGCEPSLNIYEGLFPEIKVDGAKYRIRSAGGHIHIGCENIPVLFKDRQRLVAALDVLVGNTCVLLDRDPMAAERRVNYGRPGEYRLPSHGLEYRTVSNFWLRHPSLMDLVFGLTAFATAVVVSSQTGADIEQELIDLVDISLVIKAVQENNFDLAMKNFKGIMPFLAKYGNENFPLGPSNLDQFVQFADAVWQIGLDGYFPEDQLTYWTRNPSVGFRNMLLENVG